MSYVLMFLLGFLISMSVWVTPFENTGFILGCNKVMLHNNPMHLSEDTIKSLCEEELK